MHPTVRPNKLIKEAIATSGEDVTAKDRNNLRRHIYRERRKAALASVAVRRLVSRQTRVVTPGRGERFVFVEPVDSARPPVVAVTCATNLRLLCGFLTLYADTAPRGCHAEHFDSTYVVHAYKDGLYVPLAYLLLPAEDEQDEDEAKEVLRDACGGRPGRYARAWRFLAELCRFHGLVFIPGSIRVDVDADARAAVRSVFPGCRVLACRFHLVRTWHGAVRRPDRHGADDDGDDDSRRRAETGRWTRAFAGLSFLPAAEVSDAFCDLVAIAPDGRRATAYSDHVLDNYVDRDAPWPPYDWAEAPTDPARAAVGPQQFRRHCKRQFVDNTGPPSVHKVSVVILIAEG